MELYVGMDVSLKETSICVVDGSGKIVSEGTVISEPAAIAEFIEAKAVGALRIGLETGPTTTWLWHELRALGLPVLCIDARQDEGGENRQIGRDFRSRGNSSKSGGRGNDRCGHLRSARGRLAGSQRGRVPHRTSANDEEISGGRSDGGVGDRAGPAARSMKCRPNRRE